MVVIDETMQAFMEFINSGVDVSKSFTKPDFVNGFYTTVKSERLSLLFELLVELEFFKVRSYYEQGIKYSIYTVNSGIIRLLRYLDNPARGILDNE